MYKFWIYKKANENDSLVDNILSLLPRGKVSECYIYTDSARDLISYRKLKSDVSINSGILVFITFDDISTDCSVLIQELRDLLSMNIFIASLEFKSTFVFSSLEANHAAINVLIDFYDKFFSTKSSSIIKFHSSVGRKKFAYPDNWNYLYTKWKNKEISTTDFLKLSKLRKGTFYHLVKDYEMVLSHLITVRKLV